jgi:CheY-like chemotaxis protein
VARVLIVEDEFTDLAILKSIVEGAGHEVYSASDGEQAYKTYFRRLIQIVITDLEMPRVDGLELIESIRTLFAETPIIVVSGARPEKLARAKSQGASVVLSKPVDPDQLLECVAQAVEAIDQVSF